MMKSRDTSIAILLITLLPGFGIATGMALRAQSNVEASQTLEIRLPEYFNSGIVDPMEARRVLEGRFPRHTMIRDYDEGRSDYYVHGIDPMLGTSVVRFEVRARTPEIARERARLVFATLRKQFEDRVQRMRQRYYFLAHESGYWYFGEPVRDFELSELPVQTASQRLPRTFGAELLGFFAGAIAAFFALKMLGYRLHLKLARER